LTVISLTAIRKQSLLYVDFMWFILATRYNVDF